MAATPVLLIPGLWAPAASMWLLGQRLARAGFRPLPFGWRNWSQPLEDGLARLREAVAAQGGGEVHLVGHSLGGLLVAALHADGGAPPGRAVTLGTPFAGSAVARWLDRQPGGRALLGDNAGLLQRGIDRWPGPAELGVVAGTLPWGMGRVTGGLGEPSDGVVAVAETALEGARDRIEIDATHTSLLLLPAVAEQVAQFLRDGAFDAACRRPRC